MASRIVNRQVLISFALLFFCCAASRAENYAVHIMSNKKIVRHELLNLPGNTVLMDALYLLPEFVARNGDDLFTGYDVCLDGKSVGENRDALLMNTLMYDVKHIEITDSPTASQQRNGPAGVINIVLKDMEEGFSGNANVSASTEVDFSTTTSLRYRKGKFSMSGLIGLEYYAPTDVSSYEKISSDREVSGVDTVSSHFFQETARFDFKYEPSEKDRFRMWLWESHYLSREFTNETNTTIIFRDEFEDQRMYGGRIVERSVNSLTYRPALDKQTSMTVMGEYRHVFRDKSQMLYSADYSLSTAKKSDRTPCTVESSLVYVTSAGKPFVLKAGADLTYKVNDLMMDDNTSLFASPYADVTYKGGKMEMNAGARYRYFRLFSTEDHDFTANLNILWQFRPHDALRLVLNRNLIRPSMEKMYPQLVWNQDAGLYIKGNPSLRQINLHNATLDYIFDRHAGNAYFVTNVSVGYNRVDGLVEGVMEYDEPAQKFYLTYHNSGVNNIVLAKSNVIMTYGIMSLSLTGNLFHNSMDMSTGKDAVNYFNIGLSPIFRFDRGWSLSGRAMYNSPQRRNNLTLGECLFASMSLNKTVGKWDFKFLLSDIFDYYTSNSEVTAAYNMVSNIDLYKRFFSVGATCRF